MSAQIQFFFFFKCVSTNLRQVNSSVVFVWIYIPSTPDSSGTCGLAKFPGLSNFASGRIYDRLGCGMAVFSICVFVQTAAMFLFLQKCDLASGFGGYWFQGQGSFQFQQDLCVTSLILFRSRWQSKPARLYIKDRLFFSLVLTETSVDEWFDQTGGCCWRIHCTVYPSDCSWLKPSRNSLCKGWKVCWYLIKTLILSPPDACQNLASIYLHEKMISFLSGL